MADNQLDRIEKMLKILVHANTTLELEGTIDDMITLSSDVKKYKVKKEAP